MMSPPVRKQIGDFVENAYYKFLITIIRSEDFGSDFYAIELNSQKATEKDLKSIAKESREIFLDEVENYMNDNHIFDYDDIPEDTREDITKKSLSTSVSDWTQKRKGGSQK
jgi:hypothetical protein